MHMLKLLRATLFCMLSILAISGCSKVTRENYDKLKVGMEYAEVVQILGEPGSCESLLAAKNCVWGKDPKTISVRLIGDKVILFSSSGL